MGKTARHQCMIYEGSPSKHLPAIAHTMRQKLSANHRCLYMNSPVMVAGIRSYLAADGLDVTYEVGRRSLVLSSASDHLVNGQFHVERMLRLLGEAVDEAVADGYEGLWATGDMTWEFGNEENLEKLTDYECGLEEMFRKYPALSGICQYHQTTLPRAAIHTALATHRTVFLNDTLSRLNPFYGVADSPRTKRESSSHLEEMLNHFRPLES